MTQITECTDEGLLCECQRILIKRLEIQNTELIEALTNIKNCKESDLTRYCKSVDDIACDTLAKYENED